MAFCLRALLSLTFEREEQREIERWRRKTSGCSHRLWVHRCPLNRGMGRSAPHLSGCHGHPARALCRSLCFLWAEDALSSGPREPMACRPDGNGLPRYAQRFRTIWSHYAGGSALWGACRGSSESNLPPTGARVPVKPKATSASLLHRGHWQGLLLSRRGGSGGWQSGIFHSQARPFDF